MDLKTSCKVDTDLMDTWGSDSAICSGPDCWLLLIRVDGESGDAPETGHVVMPDHRHVTLTTPTTHLFIFYLRSQSMQKLFRHDRHAAIYNKNHVFFY